MVRRHLAAVVVAVAVAATGCGGGSDAEEADAEAAAAAESTTTTTIDLRYEGVLLDAAVPIQELTAKLGPPLQIVSAGLTAESVTVQVRQAADVNKVDSFTYFGGAWNSGRPVELEVEDIEELDRRTYSPEDINWSAVAAAGPKALDEFTDDLEEPRLDGASFSKRSTGMVAVFSVSGLRGKGLAEVDARTGEIIISARN